MKISMQQTVFSTTLKACAFKINIPFGRKSRIETLFHVILGTWWLMQNLVYPWVLFLSPKFPLNLIKGSEGKSLVSTTHLQNAKIPNYV